MTETIAQLWNGTLDPIRYLGKNNPEIKNLEDLMHRNIEKLEEVLTEQQAKIFEAYSECINEYVILIGEQAFCDGFSLGTKILTEALSHVQQIV